MPLSPRQIAVRARESANVVVSLLQRGSEIPDFLRGYAAEYQRARVIQEPLLYRDLVETLRREALLNIASRIEGSVSKFLVKRQSKPMGRTGKRLKKKGEKGGLKKRAIRGGKKAAKIMIAARSAAPGFAATDRKSVV